MESTCHPNFTRLAKFGPPSTLASKNSHPILPLQVGRRREQEGERVRIEVTAISYGRDSLPLIQVSLLLQGCFSCSPVSFLGLLTVLMILFILLLISLFQGRMVQDEEYDSGIEVKERLKEQVVKQEEQEGGKRAREEGEEDQGPGKRARLEMGEDEAVKVKKKKKKDKVKDEPMSEPEIKEESEPEPVVKKKKKKKDKHRE